MKKELELELEEFYVGKIEFDDNKRAFLMDQKYWEKNPNESNRVLEAEIRLKNVAMRIIAEATTGERNVYRKMISYNDLQRGVIELKNWRIYGVHEFNSFNTPTVVEVRERTYFGTYQNF